MTGLTKQLLWEEYRFEKPDGYGYTRFYHHLNQQLIARKPSIVVPHKAAEKLYNGWPVNTAKVER